MILRKKKSTHEAENEGELLGQGAQHRLLTSAARFSCVLLNLLASEAPQVKQKSGHWGEYKGQGQLFGCFAWMCICSAAKKPPQNGHLKRMAGVKTLWDMTKTCEVRVW